MGTSMCLMYPRKTTLRTFLPNLYPHLPSSAYVNSSAYLRQLRFPLEEELFYFMSHLFFSFLFSRQFVSIFTLHYFAAITLHYIYIYIFLFLRTTTYSVGISDEEEFWGLHLISRSSN